MKHVNKFEDFVKEKRGLWDNVWAKRKRGEKPAKPGDEDYPDDDAFDDASEDKVVEGNEIAQKRGENSAKMRDVQQKIKEIQQSISELKQDEVDPRKIMILQLGIQKETLKLQSLQVNDKILIIKSQME